MKIVILGNGLIGKATAEKLVADNCDVMIASRSIDERTEGVQYVQLSFEEIIGSSSIFENADTVIQTISTSSPASSMNNICTDAHDNVLLNVQLIDRLVKLGIPKFIFLSSGGAVYGKDAAGKKIDETHATEPISAYGVAKLAVEKYLQLYGYHYGLNYLIIRPSNVYGLIKNLKKPQGVINHIIDSTLNQKKFRLWGSPVNRKDYLYTGDLAEALALAAVQQESFPSRIYNIAYGETHSIGEIISIVEKLTGKKLDIEQVTAAGFDVTNIEVDGSRFRQDFNWRPVTDLENGIARILSKL